jgi:hypothetical protein
VTARLGRIAGRLLLGVVGLVVGAVMVSLLREATLSTHQPVSRYSQVEILLHARTARTERNQSLAEHVQAQVLFCRLEVASDVVRHDEVSDGVFRYVLQPALDETNRRQLKGCLEDFVIDGLQMDVVEMKDL